ncbi:AMP-binding protein [Chloroflexota bacterium]
MTKRMHKDIIQGWQPYTDEEIERYTSKGFWQNLTVGDVLDRNAINIPDKMAIADDKVEINWTELKQKADRIAIHLKKLGLESGDFVILQTPNVIEFYYLLFGLARIGAISVMCLPRHRKVEISHLVGLHQAKAIIVPTDDRFDYVSMVEELRQEHPYLKLLLSIGSRHNQGWISIDELLEDNIEKDYAPDYLTQFKPDPNDLFIAQLSGGTTGVPKSIPKTHNVTICQWDHGQRPYGLTDQSIYLTSAPLAHNLALSAIAGPMFYRGGITIVTKSTKAEDTFRLIEKYRVTHMNLLPLLIIYLMESDEARKKYDISSLKVIGAGGQKVKPELVKWCVQELGVSFSNTFGMTEGPTLSTRWDSPVEHHINTVGKPIIIDECVETKLVNENNEEVKPGEIGELVGRGLLTFKGYFKNPEENAKCFDKQGFFHTGDLFSIREDGSYIVEGRKKDMLIRGGENIYPEPVEGWLMKNPKILNAAVVGMADARLGERLCAFVKLVEGENFDFEEMKQYLKEEGVAVFQWPERLEIVSGWPLTPMDKIDKRMLRAYITTKQFQEKAITKDLADEYLRTDKITVAEILSGNIRINFTGTPS